MPVKRISITKKIPNAKKPYVVPIKKTSFVPGLLESFKKLKKKKIIQEIISSKKTPEKVSFAQPIEEVLKEKEQEIEKKTIKKQKIKTEKKKKQNPKKKKTVQKKKSKKAKSKKKKKESPSISKLRKIAKQPKQPNVFDDLKNMYK
ncbi:hypothetical protein KY314_05230 [Candidatus Woesearchaeota archaeon]|nr:hypothetical protein [Candidatus Woesearchaeota archaeon]